MTIALLSDSFETPIGPVILVAHEGMLIGVEFNDKPAWLLNYLERRYSDFELHPTKNPFGFTDRLQRYFTGELAAIEDIPVSAKGSDFEERVWAELRRIPCGTTTSYGKIAQRVGDRNAMRAVGIANNHNPVAIVVPCHRVIGADGTLVGYGGGLERKSWLLKHEGVFLRDGHLDTQKDLFD